MPVAFVVIAAAHNGGARQLPPRLDLRRARRKQARRMSSPPTRRDPSRPDRPQADRKDGAAGAWLRFLLGSCAASPGQSAASSSRRSASPPARCCRAVHRRLSGRLEMALRLFALSFPLEFPPVHGRIFGQSAEARRRRRVPPSGEDADLDQASHRPARRHHRDAQAAGSILNGQSLAARALAPLAMPISANSPCRVVPPATPERRCTGAASLTASIRPSARRLPGGPSYTVLDQRAIGQPRRQFRDHAGSDRPCVRHGRQSRRQSRQPLSRASEGGRRHAARRRPHRTGRWSLSGRPTAARPM